MSKHTREIKKIEDGVSCQLFPPYEEMDCNGCRMPYNPGRKYAVCMNGELTLVESTVEGNTDGLFQGLAKPEPTWKLTTLSQLLSILENNL